MKKKSSIYFGVALIFLLGLSACGEGVNKDAQSFCTCVGKLKVGTLDPQCDADMKALQDGFRKDSARFQAFKDAAMKSCPSEKELIEHMN